MLLVGLSRAMLTVYLLLHSGFLLLPRSVATKHNSMNKLELRSYLKQIYGVDIENVNTKNVLGQRVRTRMPGNQGLGNLYVWSIFRRHH
jgi:hypothetical protein